MPRNGLRPFGLVSIPAENAIDNLNEFGVRPRRNPHQLGLSEQITYSDRQARMLMEWMREMHFSPRNSRQRGSYRGRVFVRIRFLKPLKTTF
ncbi:MAG TPA: hypothetical protein PKC65_12495 [Pyrinomonadaceae bacterium]|nr:hypothetical protein [Pyrinomonadaceae bacterium]